MINPEEEKEKGVIMPYHTGKHKKPKKNDMPLKTATYGYEELKTIFCFV